MPVFKVWNRDRSVKKSCVASSLEELMLKGCEKLDISPNGCKVVDESDGTIIDDDDVLMELKENVFILLENNDEWTPPKQSTSHQTESVDVGAATSLPMCTVMTAPRQETDVGNKKVDYLEFCSELQSLSTDHFDLEHLMAVARSLVSLDISEDQWKCLWENATFLKFINNSASHHPAEMHVVSLLRSNDTAQKLAPEHILDRFAVKHDVCGSGVEVVLPQQLNNLSEVGELLQRIANSNNVPVQFLRALKASVNDNTQLEREMTEANAMIHWSPDSRTFVSPWNMNTVKQALANINAYQNKHSNEPQQKLSRGKQAAAVSALSGPGTDSSIFREIDVLGLEEKRGKMTEVLLGGQTFNITQMEYYIISVILPKPQVHETQLEGFVAKVLPHVLQRVKMRGCGVLQPSRLSALVRRQEAPDAKHRIDDPFSPKSTSGDGDMKRLSCPVSRLDCLSCLLGSVDSIVAKDLLQVMSQFPMAFPLIMRNIADEGKYRLMTSLLRGIVVKWESGHGKIIEHSLFNDAFKLLVAVRLGDNCTGKSAVLNQILAKENSFSTRGEPGSEYGKPATVDGSVEFIWLTQETCKDILWESVISQYYRGDENTIILLANLHGDAVENSDMIALLNDCFHCQYLAFIMPSCSENHWKRFKSMLPSKDQYVSTIRVDPKDYHITHPNDIQTSCIIEDKTLHKVRSSLDGALKTCPSVQRISTNQLCSRVSLADGIETDMSQTIIDYVTHHTCKSTKEHLQLQLQVPRRNKQNIQQLSTTTHDAVRQFIRILQSQPSVMQRAVIHLENELSRLSNAETQKVRSNVSKLKADLRKAMLTSDSNSKDIASIRANVTDALKVMDSMNLGLEHFFREVGYLYQLQLSNKTQPDVLMLPRNVADLFLNGHPVELLDGDSGCMQTSWLNAIFKCVAEKYPMLRVYVVSIIGLQSSGKSTLLNSLFACRFAVSVGRCSRGLFIRLLFLDKEIAKTCKVDAILLIDSEGLGSPEKMGDIEAEKKDRLLATFAMGISNLTIINVLGEYINELAEILQIAVVTMTRLEQADIAPDILMVQHLLTEKNSEKLSQSEEQFCEAIRNAIDLADKKDVQVGVRDTRCLRELFARIQNGTLLTQFHPYKDGATANAPASEAYHNDVVNLYQKILECCKTSRSVFEFKNWKTLLESYWECVTQEDFSLRFKNVKEMHDFIDLGDRIAEVKKAIEDAFGAHARERKAQLVRDLHSETLLLNQQDFIRKLEHHMKLLPHGCTSAVSEKCSACKDACERQQSLYEYVQNRPHETETQATITKFIQVVRQSTIHQLSQRCDALVMQQGCCVEFDNIITRHLKMHLSTRQPGRVSEDHRKQIMSDIFKELWTTARQREHEEPVRCKIAEAILHEYPQVADMLDRFNSNIDRFKDIFDEKHALWKKATNKLKNFFGLDQRSNEIEFLKSEICLMLSTMLQQRQAECYEDGMVGELNSKLTALLNDVSKQLPKIHAEQKTYIHVWTLQQFCKRIEDIQAAWDKKNKPSSILEENKEHYVQTINARLQHGFSCAAEGQIIGQHLLKATQQKAVAAENMTNVQAVEGLIWTTNSQNVRLKYFKHLAEELRRGNKPAALAHFQNPTEEIEAWYKTTVDEYRSTQYGKTFANTFEQEFVTVLCKVQTGVSIDEVVRITKEYTAGVESLYYQPSSDFSYTENLDELEVMKNEIVTTMNENKRKFRQLDDKLFSCPSSDASVMSRLGCTATCFWCGALCWGQRGHEQNQDETRKHHSSHQPSGLASVHNKHTRHLRAQPCHKRTDNTRVHFGEYRDTGMLWPVAKKIPFQ